MAKDIGGVKGGEQKARGIPPNMSESEIADLEKETMERVSSTISALEGAMATWEASSEKPEELKEKFARYRMIHGILSNWQLRALKSYAKSDVEERVKLLWEFVDICKANIPGGT
jgi:hypothetical protein